MSRHLVLSSLALGICHSAVAQPLEGLSEKDFLSEMPIILSVSRLPQRLDDTPGAVTILDRDWIRLSGARDVADLMRLVPGFQSSNAFESDAPQASYHGAFGGYSSRIQVLVDGRSVYSPFLLGSVAPGLQSVALGDIERIEVLRGSNSAAYGARAMLGVINIVTRHTADTLGVQVALGAGGNDVRDAQARLGWGVPDATFRLTLDRRADAGLAGANGYSEVNRANFRADVQANARDEIQFRAGVLTIDSGKGFAGSISDAQRDRYFGSGFLQLDWRRNLAEDEDLAVSLSHGTETYRDLFPFSLKPLGVNGDILIDFSGRASIDNLSVQHSFRRGPDWRVVWGGELRRERVTSNPLYNTDAALVIDFTRLFANAEWRMASNWVLNAGAMAEHIKPNGSTLAPRVMVNWHAAEGHTLRAGVSRAYRPPSTFENYGDIRYYFNGRLLRVTTQSGGAVQPESLWARELGYLLDLPKLGAQVDVRAFHERMDNFIWRVPVTGRNAQNEFINFEDFSIHGLEYQAKWRPWRDAQINVTQAAINIKSSNWGLASSAPNLATTLAFRQKFSQGLELSLSHQHSSPLTFQGAGDVDAVRRTDVRLGLPLRWGQHRGDLALVVQNLGPANTDYRRDFLFQRRAFVTLRLEN
jgi:iron complex outermembrane receptor protein